MCDQKLRILFHGDRCIQCHACESACAIWRGDGPEIRRRRVRQLWQGDYPDLRGTVGMTACQHCQPPLCLEACRVGALYRQEGTGLVLLREERCVGCRACLRACPYGVPQFRADGVMVKCDLCFGDRALFEQMRPPCVRTCPVQALELRPPETEGKAAVTQRTEKENEA